MTPREWWRAPGSPSYLTLWWAVEHLGHPAFYLRALMPGDFGPFGIGPIPRHAYTLDGQQIEEFPVRCCMCTLVPDPQLLEPIERKTGLRGRRRFFAPYYSGKEPWPKATGHETCWMCSEPTKPATILVQDRRVCRDCARFAEIHGRLV